MIRRPPRSTRTDTLFPYTTLFRARLACCIAAEDGAVHQPLEVRRFGQCRLERSKARRDGVERLAVAGQIEQRHRIAAAEAGLNTAGRLHALTVLHLIPGPDPPVMQKGGAVLFVPVPCWGAG